MNYRHHYDNLIRNAVSRNNHSGYFEQHHILPKCLGGSDEPSNLVKLTAEEHYVAHQLLVKLHPKVYAVSYAAVMMTRGTSQAVRSNKMYGWLKKRFSEDMSVFQKERFGNKENHPCFGKFGEDHPRFGKPHSEDSKKRIGDAHRGKKVSSGTREKMSVSMIVRFNTPEFKEKISIIRKAAFKGDKNPAYGTKMINNGSVRKRIPKDQAVPEGWNLGATFNKLEK